MLNWEHFNSYLMHEFRIYIVFADGVKSNGEVKISFSFSGSVADARWHCGVHLLTVPRPELGQVLKYFSRSRRHLELANFKFPTEL